MAGRAALTPGWRLVAGLYPFGAGAVAVKFFFASLVLSWLGAPVLEPTQPVAGALILGLRATYPFARHIRPLMAEAERAP